MSETEVKRARAQMKAGLLMGLESPSSRAERHARMMQIWGRIPDLSETIERVDAVGTADVRRFGETLANGAKSALALYGPISKAPDLQTLQRRLVA
jgi:predicted Zn-dependent peptidase